MNKCDLCGYDFPQVPGDKRKPNDHIAEVRSIGAKYCQVCWDILEGKTKMGAKKRQRKVRIKYSDYPLPGFCLTCDKKRYKRDKN
jgi:hypothetical protein